MMLKIHEMDEPGYSSSLLLTCAPIRDIQLFVNINSFIRGHKLSLYASDISQKLGHHTMNTAAGLDSNQTRFLFGNVNPFGEFRQRWHYSKNLLKNKQTK